MKEVRGQLVFESLAEVVNPSHTALLVIDMQNYGCSSDSRLAAAGVDISPKRAIIPSLQRLLSAARHSGVRVVYLKLVTENNLAGVHPAWTYYVHCRAGRVQLDGKDSSHPVFENATDGTWEAEVTPELAPQPGDFEVKKHRKSAFINTRLDQVLRSDGVQSVLVTGVSTENCVLTTALDAQGYDYYAVVVRDCVGSMCPERAAMAMSLMQRWFDMPTSEELIATWANGTGTSGGSSRGESGSWEGGRGI